MEGVSVLTEKSSRTCPIAVNRPEMHSLIATHVYHEDFQLLLYISSLPTVGLAWYS